MKHSKIWLVNLFSFLAVVFLASGALAQQDSQDQGTSATGAPEASTTGQLPPSKEERHERFMKNHPDAKEKFEKMTPEQRAKMKEHRKKKREALKDMTPEERQKAMQERKEKKGKFKSMTPEERHNKMKERHEDNKGERMPPVRRQAK